MSVLRLYIALVFLGLNVSSFQALAADESLAHADIEEFTVWGEKRDSRAAGYTNPTSLLTQEDMVSINVATTEDLVKYEPNLVIRRRFIGDSNGTLGMRGSNMFQTSRSMVFADGVPLHYFLQSRWSGAPRWTMVSASEISQVEVLYGPFSAEYSGNAMGGVVLIETAIPQKQEFHFDANIFAQEFEAYGFDDQVNGFKGFVSYADKVGSLSYYLSFNHLDNESQPQTFRYGGSSSSVTPTAVTGALAGNDERGDSRLWYGDTGVVETVTDNYKFKVGYEFGKWFALLNIAFEDRHSVTDSANSYLSDLTGQTIWSGDVNQNSQMFSVSSSHLNASELYRESLSVGLRMKGEIKDDVNLEVNVNSFNILKDENRSSARNPNDPAYSLDGEVNEYDDSGWQTAEVKMIINDLANTSMQLITGVRHESYELNLNVYQSSNYTSGAKGDYRSRFGGQTSIDAIFSQLNWGLNDYWDVALGIRYESFESRNGYFDADDISTPEFDLAYAPSVSNHQLSPKFSIGYEPNDRWLFRYSTAKAYRFPIVEELFSQYEAYNTVSESNPELKPEDGLHHNLMFDKSIEGGYWRINVFQETIKNAIESQLTTTPNGTSLRTFVPIDKVATQGVEFIVNNTAVFNSSLDMRFNMAYTDSEIVSNAADPSIEGNNSARMPKWRVNLLATYHVTTRWDIGANLQYASDSFGRNDNTDEEDNVYGAQDGYTRIGLKTSYGLSEKTKISFGIDNLTNEIAYVAHPWPGRTLYLNFSYDM